MPKIQLSALATDMKGKSGGSVFARNKGGLYFRNNPKPVQKKSYSWASQKSKFTSLSTSWRALTNEQRIAWEEAGVLYPGTDAWGNSYVPSGYQLYMRLNGTLKSYNLPLLSVPAAPGTWPEDFDNIISYTPENFAFTPKTCATLTGRGAQNWYLLGKNYIDGGDLSGTTHLSMRFVRSKQDPTNNPHGCVIRLHSLTNTSDYGYFSFITLDNNGKYILYVVYNYQDENTDPVSEVKTYDITREFQSGQFHLIYKQNPKYTPDPAEPLETLLVSQLYLNGYEATALDTVYYDALQDSNSDKFIPNGNVVSAPFSRFSSDFDGTLRVGNYNGLSTRALSVSDIRYWDILAMGAPCGCESDEDCPEDYDCYQCQCTLSYDGSVSYDQVRYILIAHGYVLGNESAITPLTNLVSGTFETFSDGSYPGIVLTNDEDCCDPSSDCADFSDQECRDCCCIYVGDEPWPTPNINYTFTPFVSVTPVGLVDTDFYLAVYVTKAVGLGRSGNNTPYKHITTIPPFVTPIRSGSPSILLAGEGSVNIGEMTANISSALRNFLGSMSSNTQVYVSFGIINPLTGEITECKPKKPKAKNPIRFKAGSELSSSVN